MSIDELKAKLLELLRKDEKFRYAVAGLIGLDTILNELKKLREDFSRRFEVIERKLLEHDKHFKAIEKKLLEHDKRFETLEKILLEHTRSLNRIELEIETLNESFYCKAL